MVVARVVIGPDRRPSRLVSGEPTRRLVEDASRQGSNLARCADRRWFAPAISADRLPPRLDAGEAAEPRDELTIGESRRRFARDRAEGLMGLARFTDESFQAFAHGARTKDQHVVVRGHAPRDRLDESPQVLEAVGLTGRLGSAAPVAHGRIVTDMAGGTMVGRDVGVHPLDADLVAAQADDDRLACVDPDECAIAHDIVSRGPPVRDVRGHEQDQAVPASVPTARSAYTTPLATFRCDLGWFGC